MKRLALLLALLLGAAAALRAQPTNREYKRLHEATTRAYSTPDRPAPASTPAERTYTPSSSSGANTPYSGGMQVVVPGTSLFGAEKARRREEELERQKRLEQRQQAEQAAKLEAERTAKEKDDKRMAKEQIVYEREQDALDNLADEWFKLRYGLDDARGLGVFADKTSRSPSAEATQALAQVKQARTAVNTRWKNKNWATATGKEEWEWSQPEVTFAQARALVNAEWVPAQQGRPALGMYTALADYALLQQHFPAEASALEADLARLHVSFLTFDVQRMSESLKEVTRYLPQHRAVIERAMLGQAPELLRNFGSLTAGKMSDAVKYNNRAVFTVKHAEYRYQDHPAILRAVQLVQQALEAENTRHGTTPERQSQLSDCAQLVLELQKYLAERQQLNQQVELKWKLEALRPKLADADYLLALTDAQAQEVQTLLGVGLGDQSTRARLARMLPPLKAVPDNPDWQALKAGDPLSETIRQLADKLNNTHGYLLLGTLTACTKPGKEGQETAMDYWNNARKAKVDDNSKYFVRIAAARNMYRTLLLGQSTEFKYRSDSAPLEKKQAYWVLQIEGGNSVAESYDQYLVLLDQSPDFPAIGIRDKKRGKAGLEVLAKSGYEPAKAKLKEL